MSKQVKDWITVNHKHVPIYEGESKEDAYNRVVAKDNEDKKEKDIAKNKEQADELNGKSKKSSKKPIPIEDSVYGVSEKHIDGFWEDTSYIEPGTKEWHEPYDTTISNANEIEQVKFFNDNIVASKEQIDALETYARGDYKKSNLEEKYNLSKVVEQNTGLHLGDATLYRGGNLSDEEFNNLLNGKLGSMFDGLTSWSVREDVAHMYAQGDNTTGEVFGGRKPTGHRVVFIESGTNDSMILPFTYPQNETLRSKNRTYKIKKIIPEKQYKKIKDKYSANSGFNEPVTYVYVESEPKRGK